MRDASLIAVGAVLTFVTLLFIGGQIPREVKAITSRCWSAERSWAEPPVPDRRRPC